jgi:hypothetical protein
MTKLIPLGIAVVLSIVLAGPATAKHIRAKHVTARHAQAIACDPRDPGNGLVRLAKAGQLGRPCRLYVSAHPRAPFRDKFLDLSHVARAVAPHHQQVGFQRVRQDYRNIACKLPIARHEKGGFAVASFVARPSNRPTGAARGDQRAAQPFKYCVRASLSMPAAPKEAPRHHS